MTTANPTTSTTGSESCNAMTGVGAGEDFNEDLHERQARKAAQALRNATSGQSFMNYEGIYSGFQAMGIPADDIKPRVNVFTFNAWKALGRYVRQGQQGVKVCTFVSAERTEKDTGAVRRFRMPRQTTVFHLSQTNDINQ